MPLLPSTPEERRRRYINAQIMRLRNKPRTLEWILMKAQETGFDPDFLSMILSELAEGGVLEQLRADGPQENLWKRIQARRKVAKNIRSTLVKIIIKSANDDFLMKVYKDGWIGVCAVARLEFYCAKRNRIRTNSRDNTPAHAA